MSDNTFKKKICGDLYDRWPKDENGEPEEPAFLCRCRNNDLSDVIRANMLEGFEIPCLLLYPGDGSFGKVILGMSGEGTDIYVPKSLLDDAVQLCMNTSFDDEDCE